MQRRAFTIIELMIVLVLLLALGDRDAIPLVACFEGACVKRHTSSHGCSNGLPNPCDENGQPCCTDRSVRAGRFA